VRTSNLIQYKLYVSVFPASMLRPSVKKNSTDTYIQVSAETMVSRYPVTLGRQISVLLKRAVLCTIRDLVRHSKNIRLIVLTLVDSKSVLTMVYNTQDYWVFWTLSIVRYSKKQKRTQRFGNRTCFRPQLRGETFILLGHPVTEVSSF
jgi:hypothetical protein